MARQSEVPMTIVKAASVTAAAVAAWLGATVRALTRSPTIPFRRPCGVVAWVLLSWHLLCNPIRRLRACSWCGADMKIVVDDTNTEADDLLDFQIMECSRCSWWDALPERWDR